MVLLIIVSFGQWINYTPGTSTGYFPFNIVFLISEPNIIAVRRNRPSHPIKGIRETIFIAINKPNAMAISLPFHQWWLYLLLIQLAENTDNRMLLNTASIINAIINTTPTGMPIRDMTLIIIAAGSITMNSTPYPSDLAVTLLFLSADLLNVFLKRYCTR